MQAEQEYYKLLNIPKQASKKFDDPTKLETEGSKHEVDLVNEHELEFSNELDDSRQESINICNDTYSNEDTSTRSSIKENSADKIQMIDDALGSIIDTIESISISFDEQKSNESENETKNDLEESMEHPLPESSENSEVSFDEQNIPESDNVENEAKNEFDDSKEYPLPELSDIIEVAPLSDDEVMPNKNDEFDGTENVEIVKGNNVQHVESKTDLITFNCEDSKINVFEPQDEIHGTTAEASTITPSPEPQKSSKKSIFSKIKFSKLMSIFKKK